MIRDIPEDIINFEPPDYELEGSEVLEIIKEMPIRPIIPVNREPTPIELCYAEMRRKKHPNREVPPIGREVIEVLYDAVQEMIKIFKNMKVSSYTISKYNVLLAIHTNYDIAAISFCPKVETFIEEVPFEVPNRGVWKNGPGVSFFYSLSSKSLLKKIYMR